MSQPLKVLIVEDNPDDAELLLRALRKAGFAPDWQRVDTEAGFIGALQPSLDLVLSDYEMPQFSGLQALGLLKERHPRIPFIIVSGTIGEDTAVEAMKQGASDYLLKDRLARLGPAITQALEQGRLRRERHQALESLSLFRTLVDQSSDGFEVLDLASGRYLDINEMGCRELGYSREELLGMSVADIDPNATAANWAEFVRRLRTEGRASGEGIHQRKDGTSFPIEFVTRLVRLDRDYLVSAVRNITERQQAEAALRESERRLRDLLENVELIAMTLDQRGRVTFCNDYLLRLTGWRREEVIGADWCETFLPGEAEETKALFFSSIDAGTIPAHHENPIKTRSGERREISWSNTTLRDAAGNVVGVASIGEDVTKRKQALAALRESEERFRQMAENIDEVFWMTDADKNQMLYISPGYEKIWGRRCEELYTSPLVWIEAILPEDRVRVLAAATTKQAAGDYDEEYRITRPDGAVRWIHDRAFPIKDATGRAYRITGVAEDITERKKLEELFLRAQRMEAIGTLAGGMAHDLNNILAPSLMVAGLLKTKLADPKDRQLLDMVESGTKRGAHLIRQLLMFSRGVSGARAPVQLRHLLAEMLDIMRETFPREITIAGEIPADLAAVNGDATQLHQVLLNLCVNARDAMPGGGRLALGAQNFEMTAAGAAMHPEAKTGRYVIVTVSDTGQGIPPENLQRIFDPFFTTKEVGKGTGLGLSTVMGIVKNHDGFVTVYSELGRGTAFKVYLPVEPGTSVPRADSAGPVLPRGYGELVLVVDDEAPIAAATRLTLEQQDYRVLVASQGREAVELFLAHQDTVRLVLTDVMMPVMDGPALVRALRTLKPELPVIATTGLEQEGRQAELAQLGVTEILLKPCSPRDLLAAVARQLSRQ